MSAGRPVTAPGGEGATGVDATRTAYEDLRDLGLAAAQQGRLEESKSFCREALRVARELAEPILESRALCNLAAVEIETGDGETYLAPLREILVRNSDDESCRLASYNLARGYEVRGEHRKALFYSRIGSERAARLANVDWIASSRNQMGNILLAQCREGEAEVEFREALELLGDDGGPLCALILDNLGYCHFLRKRWSDGFACTFRSLRIFRRRGARLWETRAHLTLAYGFLEIGRWQHAGRNALRALQLAEAVNDLAATKISMFLLGETANLSGDTDTAYAYFERLQKRFFPDQPYLPSFLLAVDVRSLINLKA